MTSINPSQPNVNFNNLGQVGQNRESFLDLLQNSKLEGAIKLFSQTGLPDILKGNTLKESLIDSQDVNIDHFASAFRNQTDFPSAEFSEVFKGFSEDQVIAKGYFSPKEALQEWPVYLEGQNDSAKHAKMQVDSFVTAEANAPAAAKEVVSTEDPAEGSLDWMYKVLDALVNFMATCEELAMTQSKQLEVETSIQNFYIEVQSTLKPIDPNDATLFEDPGSDEAQDVAEMWNVNILPTLQEQNRSYKEVSQERSKAINAKINESTTNIQRLADIFSEILAKLSSTAMSILR